MTIHAWLLMGQQSRRKGSTIRALTGLYQERYVEVMLINGQSLRMWVKTMSVNEPDPAPDPVEWVHDCENRSHYLPPNSPPISSTRRNILVALRLQRGVPGREAWDYLNALSAANAAIESIVTLGEQTPAWVLPYGAPYAHIDDILDGETPPQVAVPSNSIADQVRTFWGWR